MTGTAGTVAAAMAAGHVLKLDHGQMLHALGSAGTQAAGLWEFLRDAADSKQLHTAKASADGLIAAWTASQGLTAASQILEGGQGMAAGMMGEGDVRKITDGLGSRWALMETSFKYHASCRHTHPAADALLELCNSHNVRAGDVAAVNVYVYQAAKDVLGAVDVPETIHQSKFSMGFVLALIIRYGSAGVADFTEDSLADPENAVFREKVTMVVDCEIDDRYPDKWASKVELTLVSGERISCFVDCPKGDPDNMLSRDELEDKVMRLAQHSGKLNAEEVSQLVTDAWKVSGFESFSRGFRRSGGTRI
jgi:2-methylcitrate dehydratase PrpD